MNEVFKLFTISYYPIFSMNHTSKKRISELTNYESFILIIQ